MPIQPVDRRAFLGLGAGALVCTIGGERITLNKPADTVAVDTAARKLRRPAAKAAQAGDANEGTFPTPTPAPGGRVREYWIQARSRRWTIVPKAHDEWHDARVRGKTTFRAFVYQLMTAGFDEPAAPATMPGPTLYADVGDLLVVHFRNADEHFGQAVTMHPHGVRYNPDYDGAYLGDHTRVGGFVAPGEEFTYRWEATPDSVGVWPYHDHGPNHTINTHRGLFGTIIVRPRGAKLPDVERTLFLGSFDPAVTGLRRTFQTINGRAYAGNTPTIEARVGDDVALHVMGGDGFFHDFHIHGHRWKDAAGTFVDTPTVGPNETITARFVEDNPGRWLYHCHVFAHQDGGMAGWYDVRP
jgi:FtsP/CotA-like multicopper oxidase with cupredoxin domain